MAASITTVQPVHQNNQDRPEYLRRFSYKGMESRLKSVRNLLFQKKSQLEATKNKLRLFEEEIKRMEAEEQQLLTAMGQTSIKESAEEQPAEKPKLQKEEKPDEEKQRLKEVINTSYPKEDKKKKWYVVFDGPQKGVYTDWGVVQHIVKGKTYGHKAYSEERDARAALDLAYRTMLQAKNKEIIRDEPQKMKVIPKIPQILTEAQKAELRRLTGAKFATMVSKLTQYREGNRFENYYPARTDQGAKAVILPGANSELVHNFVSCGLCRMIFLSKDLGELKGLPANIQKAVSLFKKNVSKEQNLVLKFQSSLPWITEDQTVTLDPLSIIFISTVRDNTEEGSSSLTYPSLYEDPRAPEEKDVFRSIEGIISRVLAFKNGAKVFVNYRSIVTMMLSSSKAEAKPEVLKEIQKFIKPFEILQEPPFSRISKELRTRLCELVKKFSKQIDHTCTTCLPKIEDKEEFPDFNSEESLEIITED